MSMLKIFRPDEEPETHDAPTSPNGGSARPVPVRPVASSRAEVKAEVYSFAEWVDRLRGDSDDLADRARSIHANCRCPRCNHAGVLPLMLNDGHVDGAGQIVPGTASLVGFRCEDCRHEWATLPTAKERIGS